MIVHAWYPIRQYRLSFGMFDNLKKPVDYVAEKYGFASNCDERELLEFIYKTEDKVLNKMMKELTFKNINSRKSDKLLSFEEYINDFCDIQYKAFSFICEKRVNSAAEEYLEVLRLESTYEYYKYSNEEDFNRKIRQCISPLYQIAVNQGFEVAENIFN